jgi:flagellar biosynthesis protein FliP
LKTLAIIILTAFSICVPTAHAQHSLKRLADEVASQSNVMGPPMAPPGNASASLATSALGGTGLAQLPALLRGATGSAAGTGVDVAEPEAAQEPESRRAMDVSTMNPLSVMAGAASALPGQSGGISSNGEQPKGGLSTAINILLLLTVMGLAPSIILMCTCFMRMLIVLGFLRQAIGTQSIPPPQIVTALALFMTLLVMTPTIERIQNEAVLPYQRGEIRDYGTLWERSKAPMRDFMFDQIESTGNWSSVYMLLEYRGKDISKPELLTRDDVDMVVLVPAYMLSELKVAFLMGFRVYLPFLVIDMVISTMLISMGMMMLPPVMISLPFKLLLFVLVDGWTLVVGSLMYSFTNQSAATQVSMTGFDGLVGVASRLDPQAIMSLLSFTS